jgi:hypothetical protein
MRYPRLLLRCAHLFFIMRETQRKMILAITGMMMLVIIDFFVRFDTVIPEKAAQKTIIYPRICKEKDQEKTWIMFMGDSNMRHTYNWWTGDYRRDNEQFVAGSTFGLDRTDLEFGGRWADQELLYKEEHCNRTLSVSEEHHNKTLPNAACEVPSIIRLSFRFLHGSITEFVDDSNHWDIARVGAASPNSKDVASTLNNTTIGNNSGGSDDHKGDLSMNWTGSIRPSDYALWATKHQLPIDANSPKFDAWMAKWYNKTSPDVIILTQGWGGIPRSDQIDIVKAVVMNNPETLFVWAPMYVTNRSPERYASFVQSGVFQRSERNLHMVDLWNLTKQLPYTNDTTSVYHATVGGQHMQQSMQTIWDATKCRNYTDWET